MRLIRIAKPVILALTLCVTSAVAIVLAEGNDFVIGDLRVDLSEVYYARDYKVHLLANDKPSSGSDDDFTTAWLGVFLAQYIPGVPDSGQFSQVGLLTKKDGIRWFVYAEPTVTCLRGWHDPDDDRHCYGFVDEIVTLGSWHQVELVKYTQNNYWIARVYDSGGTAYDVAKIWSDSNRIYMARSDTEEGYVESSDPYLTASFHHWHPQYMGTGWQEWPESSDDNCNSIWTEAINGPDPCPDHYGADPYWTGDPRAWFAGTDGKWCDVDPLFPATYTYLPDIKANYNSWNSTIIVRNNGGGDAHVQVAFYDSNGIVVAYPSNTNLHGQAIWTLEASNVVNNFSGSAIVYASEDVSVVVMNIHDAYPYTAGSYTALVSTSSTVRLPLLHRNNYGWYSDFTVFNAGSTTTDFTVTFTPATAGYPCTQTYYNVPPSGSRNVDLTYVTCVGSTFVGGARVTSSNGQPLAAVATQWKDYTGDGVVESFMSYEGFPTAFDPLPLPLLMRNNYNWNTGLALQNAAGSSNSVALFYYHQSTTNNGAWCRTDSYTLGANGVQVVNPAPPDDGCTSGGATFVGAGLADGSQPLAGIVNQVNNTAGNYNVMSYSSPSGGTATAVVPLVMKNRDGWRGRDNWYTGLAVQNAGSASTTVTVTYYNQGGSYVTSDSKAVPARSTGIFNPAPGSGSIPSFLGSAVVTADQPIAVVVNHITSPSGTDDTSMSHSGLNR